MASADIPISQTFCDIVTRSFCNNPAFDVRGVCSRRHWGEPSDVASDEYFRHQMRIFNQRKELGFVRTIILGVHSIILEHSDADVALISVPATRTIVEIVRAVLRQLEEKAFLPEVLTWLIQYSVSVRTAWMTLLKPKRTRAVRARALATAIVECFPTARVAEGLKASQTIDEMMRLLVCEHVHELLE